jgi:membrane protease YdiL (CAAX protease family)
VTDVAPPVPLNRTHTTPDVTIPQYSVIKILAIWAAAALPMAALAWIVAPAVTSSFDGPAPLVGAVLVCLAVGLIWQFVLVAALVWREQRSFRWSVLREALWLRSPRSPRTGRVGGRLWLVVLPLLVGFAAEEEIPTVAHPANHDLSIFLGTDAGHAFLDGAWGWFGVIAVLVVFNTVLGEELLFRGFLLPRMNGAFGRRDWVANGILFAVYHLHMPWAIPSALLDTLLLAYPSKRYRSAWIGIAVHSAQSVVVLALTLHLVI